jgi:hypothetical protein
LIIADTDIGDGFAELHLELAFETGQYRWTVCHRAGTGKRSTVIQAPRGYEVAAEAAAAGAREFDRFVRNDEPRRQRR